MTTDALPSSSTFVQKAPVSNPPGEDGTVNKPLASNGTLCQIKCLAQQGDGPLVEKEEYFSSLKKPFSHYALVAKQIFNKAQKLDKTLVDINSPHIISALCQVVRYYPAEPLHLESQITFESPFQLLNHHVAELRDYANTVSNAEAKNHIQLLLDFLKSEAGDKGIETMRLIKSGLIKFDQLWVIFKPGMLLYKQEYGHARLYKLQKTGYGEDPCKGEFFEVTCEYTSCDGSRTGYSAVNLVIWDKEFVGGGSQVITHLSTFPLDFLENRESLKEQLTNRGKTYLAIKGIQLFQYDGLFMYLKTPPHHHYDESSAYDGIWLPRSGTGRVVIDCKTFVEERRQQKEEFTRFISRESSDRSGGNAIYDIDADPLLCPPYVYGFSLDLKEWCKFFVHNLVGIKWSENAMDSLILPDSERRLIRSLVTSHRFPDQARDEAQLKGKGLIMLLHGTPGSGKTLTAELSAEQTKRPLLKISTGELGSWGGMIAGELRRILMYASIWHAIVLIDEADVFLEARQTGGGGIFTESFSQNNMVAVFLKQLEHYQGILFLTSNRVQVFDQAIRSRIHLSLKYVAPDAERRRRIWYLHLTSLNQNEVDLDLEDTLNQCEQVQMNGREISNAVNTAKTLASAEGSKLKLSHLETVLKVWDDFQTALDQAEMGSTVIV